MDEVKKYVASQKLWRIVKQPDGYYYEIKLAGMVIDRFKIPDTSRLQISFPSLIKQCDTIKRKGYNYVYQ